MHVKNYNLKRPDKYKVAFILIFVIVSLFTTSKELMFPYYFRVASTILFSSIFIIFLTLMLFNKKLSFDLISLILLARLVIYLIPLLFTTTMEGYWGNYLTIIGSFFAYFISSQARVSTKTNYLSIINKILIMFINLISIEVIYMLFLLSRKYGALNINLLKYYLVLPIGGSNYLACIILPLLIFVYYSDINMKSKLFSITLSFIALFIIQSKNAVFVLLLFISYRFIKRYLMDIRNIKDNKKFVMILTIVMISTGMYLLYLAFNYLLVKWNMGMDYSNGSIYEVINALSSNRLDVYSRELLRWTNHLFLGNGLAYELGTTRSHNWLIDLLVQSGLVGFVFYLSTIIIWYKKVKPYKKSSKFLRALYYSILIILIQGLAEVSMFTLNIDIMLWIFIGISVSESNEIKRNNLDANSEIKLRID